MTFWNLTGDTNDTAAIWVDANAELVSLSYGELDARVEASCSRLRELSDTKVLGLLLVDNSITSLVYYLAALRAGHCVCLLPKSIDPGALARFKALYAPEWSVAADGTLALEAGAAGSKPLHSELSLLLSTSGSTGSPKTVRLSERNLTTNAASIAQYLELDSKARPLTTLSMAYSYGLSVINSHLAVGATLVLTDEPLTSRGFWSLLQRTHATSLAGVPYQYQILQRLGFARMDLPSLTTLTQAGGALSPALIDYFAEVAQTKRLRFFRMYGQTEATARIAYVPPTRLNTKGKGIGIAIPGGRLEVDAQSSELIYFGPNVMLGYAESRADLAKGDELGGKLHTGDLGQQDADGFFSVTGRSKRIAKLLGYRVNLDEAESYLAEACGELVACIERDGKLIVFSEQALAEAAFLDAVRKKLQLHPTAVERQVLTALPRLASGKLDYVGLASHAAPINPSLTLVATPNPDAVSARAELEPVAMGPEQ